MKKFTALRVKIYSYLNDNNDENKKNKKHKKVRHKKKTNLKIIKIVQKKNKKRCLIEKQEEFMKNNKLTLKSQQRFKSAEHNIFTEEVKKIALSANDDKRIQSIDQKHMHMEQVEI